MIFISAPYSSEDPKVVESRVLYIQRAVRLIMEAKEVPISPVLMGHGMVKNLQFNGAYDTWKNVCEKYIQSSSIILLLKLPGWQDSDGLLQEIHYARTLGKEIVSWEISDIEYKETLDPYTERILF